MVYFYNSTCFGRSPRPSSGVIFFLKSVVATTGVCHRYGVDKFIHTVPMTHTSGCHYSF